MPVVISRIIKHCLLRSRSRSIGTSINMEEQNRKSYSSEPASGLFKSAKISQNYAQFRPNYTPETYKRIYEFCRETPSYSKLELDLDLAVDVGCGSGQSSIPLTKFTKKVVGVDVSESQIAEAPSNIPGLSFRHSEAENLSFIESGSADLVTVAQAFHWFQHKKFFEEADRVLKPGGSLVIYGYGNCYLDNKEAQEYQEKVYWNVLGPYWAEGRKWIETKYASIALPYEGWRRDDSLVMEKTWTVQQLVGYLSSWSSVNKLISQNPQSTLLEDMKSE